MTREPLFTAADAAGAPPLRPGVWLFFRDPGCKVDVSRPFTEWPDCAGGGAVSAAGVTARRSDAAAGALETTPLVLAAGRPRIAEVRVTLGLQLAEAPETGGAGANQTDLYGYAAVNPTGYDRQGRIVAFESWPVQCGPPPPRQGKGDRIALVTERPLPGIELEPGAAVCSTRSKDALRAAARASRAWADHLGRARWIRDGDR